MPQDNPRDTYLQVAGSLRQKIQVGEIKDDLPSQTQLISAHGASRSTIERALKVLKAEGLVESVQGAGWYVAGTGDRRPVVEKMIDLLGADGVKVGDPFPTEKDLCEMFKASRTAVRTAIAQMEGQGLIAKVKRGREIRALPVN
ncbi:GntR family transcriptional regulator [Streptomyces sp. NPDC102360]|uniref:GntR family transcriptional regulator n=1 Tax=Streptomyces sp. NPDC102360 TaxID=3366160 RepID=UPI0038235A8C